MVNVNAAFASSAEVPIPATWLPRRMNIPVSSACGACPAAAASAAGGNSSVSVLPLAAVALASAASASSLAFFLAFSSRSAVSASSSRTFSKACVPSRVPSTETSRSRPRPSSVRGPRRPWPRSNSSAPAPPPAGSRPGASSRRRRRGPCCARPLTPPWRPSRTTHPLDPRRQRVGLLLGRLDRIGVVFASTFTRIWRRRRSFGRFSKLTFRCS